MGGESYATVSDTACMRTTTCPCNPLVLQHSIVQTDSCVVMPLFNSHLVRTRLY